MGRHAEQIYSTSVKWKTETKKASKTLEVGDYTGVATVEGVDKTISFHISNLRPCTFRQLNMKESNHVIQSLMLYLKLTFPATIMIQL